MNVLSIASSAVSVLIPKQIIRLVLLESEYIDGIVIDKVTKIDTVAHIQPVDWRTLKEDTHLQGVISKKFLVCSNKPEVLDFFNSATTSNSRIEWNNKIWTIYQLGDWELNGWRRLIAILNHS